MIEQALGALLRYATDAGLIGPDEVPYARNRVLQVLQIADYDRAREGFGPTSLILEYTSESQLLAVAAGLEGQLTATVHGEPDDG